MLVVSILVRLWVSAIADALIGENAGSEDMRKFTCFSQEKQKVNISSKNKKAT